MFEFMKMLAFLFFSSSCLKAREHLSTSGVNVGKLSEVPPTPVSTRRLQDTQEQWSHQTSCSAVQDKDGSS